MVKTPTSPHDKSPFAGKLPNFIDALEVLYIKNNVSGRHKFRETWPHAAPYIFGETLTHADTHGGLDREERATEEQQAEDRRDALLAQIQEIREKSIEGGMLQLRYIESTIHQLGREIAEDIYSDWVIEKIFPPAPPVAEIKPSPQEIGTRFNTQNTEAPTPKPQFRPNLAAKKQIVDIRHKKPPSYKDIVSWAEKFFSKSILNAFNRACGAR